MKYNVTLNGKPLDMGLMPPPCSSQIEPSHYAFGADGWLSLYMEIGNQWRIWRNDMNQWMPSPWVNTGVAVEEIPESVLTSLQGSSDWALEIYDLLRYIDKPTRVSK